MSDSKDVKSATGRRRPPAAGIGRKKGVLNKSTAAVKEALRLAFQGIGGVPELQAWAKDNQTEFYKLWAKMLPLEISGPDGGPIQGAIDLSGLTEEQQRALASIKLPAES